MIERRLVIFGAIVSLTFLVVNANAKASQTTEADWIEVSSAWARATIRAGGDAVVYFTVINSGTGVDKLLDVESPVSVQAKIHTTVVDEGVLKLRPLDNLKIDPGTTTHLEPGGTHIMLNQLFRRLIKGETFPLVLHFEKAGSVTVTVHIGATSQMEPPD